MATHGYGTVDLEIWVLPPFAPGARDPISRPWTLSYPTMKPPLSPKSFTISSETTLAPSQPHAEGAILAELRPAPVREPLPPPKVYAPPGAVRGTTRRQSPNLVKQLSRRK